MVDIGKGRYKPEIIEEAIRNQQRNSIELLPPSGLYLMEVFINQKENHYAHRQRAYQRNNNIIRAGL